MNENLDLTKILDGCPKGTKLYSSILGDVEFCEINRAYDENPIVVKTSKIQHTYSFSKEGYFCNLYENEECVLFPSKEQRDWSKFERFWDKPKVEKFDPKTFQPFDRVLAKCKESNWMPTLFGFFIDKNTEDPLTPFTDERVVCVDVGYHECIPYNDDTKHLIGTTNDCPEYYKWWEDE